LFRQEKKGDTSILGKRARREGKGKRRFLAARKSVEGKKTKKKMVGVPCWGGEKRRGELMCSPKKKKKKKWGHTGGEGQPAIQKKKRSADGGQHGARINLSAWKRGQHACPRKSFEDALIHETQGV